MRPKTLLSWTLAAAVLPALSGAAEWRRLEFAERHMGSPCRVVLYAHDTGRAEEAARAAFRELAALDAALSLFQASSELSRLNREGELEASETLFEVLTASKRLWRTSLGSFDVTVGPLVELWRQARDEGRLPGAAALGAARDRVGSRHLELGPGRRVRLASPGLAVDLGGIAKGYAADRALARLRQRGLERVLVDVGGELALGSPPPDRSCWLVEVGGGCAERLCLSECGVATSGDAARFLELDGRRYSHIVDPRTGLGTQHVARATVLAPDAATADALATALVVLGPERGLELARSLDRVEASICWRAGAETLLRRTEGMALSTPGPSGSASSNGANRRVTAGSLPPE